MSGFQKFGPYYTLQNIEDLQALITAMNEDIMRLHGLDPNDPSVKAVIDKHAIEMAGKIIKDLESLGIPEKFQQLLQSKSKNEALGIGNSITIQKREFAALIHNCKKLKWGGYEYNLFVKEFRPVELSKNDISALTNEEFRSAEGKLIGLAKKTLGKIRAVFAQRKRIHAHFFVKGNEWHCFYFDFQDVKGTHWSEGPHIHYLSHHWGYDLQTIKRQFETRNTSLRSVHIRFNEGNKETRK